MRNKRKRDKNREKIKGPEQKLGVGENVERDTFREL